MMSLMSHSPAAEWSIRNSIDRSDPSCKVIFAATRFGASIFASIQRIGLKLDAQRLPLETIVVDRAEKTPTEN